MQQSIREFRGVGEVQVDREFFDLSARSCTTICGKPLHGVQDSQNWESGVVEVGLVSWEVPIEESQDFGVLAGVVEVQVLSWDIPIQESQDLLS